MTTETPERLYHDREAECRPCALDPGHCDTHGGWFSAPDPSPVDGARSVAADYDAPAGAGDDVEAYRE